VVDPSYQVASSLVIRASSQAWAATFPSSPAVASLVAPASSYLASLAAASFRVGLQQEEASYQLEHRRPSAGRYP